VAKPFDSIIRLQMARFSPQEARKRHIAIARAGLADFMGRQPVRPMVRIETDNRPATSEEQVKPFGLIVYRFDRMREVVEFATSEARRISPVDTGRYQAAWFAMVGNAEVAAEAIPQGATVTITNDQPYAWKIHAGTKGFEKYVPPGIVEKVRQLVLRKYRPIVTAQVTYIPLIGDGKARRRPIRYPALVITPRLAR
jgi:hypothetical protein